MGQKPIAVRVRQEAGQDADRETEIITVGEAARRLGVSERTVFRLLKTGHLERVDPSSVSHNLRGDAHMTDIITGGGRGLGKAGLRLSVSASRDPVDMSDNVAWDNVRMLGEQVQQKDAQIAQMLKAQQEMSQTIQRLQEQMYELAHLVLSHNAAAAQARAEAELKLQEQAQTASRRGLAGVLNPRPRK